jgi:hypothetical protein
MPKNLYKFETFVHATPKRGDGAQRFRLVTVARNISQVETNVRKRMRVFHRDMVYVIKSITNLGKYERGEVLLRQDKKPIVKGNVRGQWIPSRNAFFTIEDIPSSEITERNIRAEKGGIRTQRLWCTGGKGGGDCYDITNETQFVKIN